MTTTEPYAAGDAPTPDAFHRVGQHAGAITQGIASSFATYLDAGERAQLDARAATAEAERDDALNERNQARRERDSLARRLGVRFEELTKAQAAAQRLEGERDDLRIQLADTTANSDRFREQLTRHAARINGLEADLRTAQRDAREMAAERDQARQIAQTYREAMIGQHEWAGHLLAGDCPDCIKAAEEMDGALACQQYQQWQREYENAIGIHLPPGLGSPCRAQEQPPTPVAADRRRHALAFNALSRVLTERREFVRLSTRERCVEAVLAALEADGRPHDDQCTAPVCAACGCWCHADEQPAEPTRTIADGKPFRWDPDENCYCGGPEEIYPHRYGTGLHCQRKARQRAEQEG